MTFLFSNAFGVWIVVIEVSLHAEMLISIEHTADFFLEGGGGGGGGTIYLHPKHSGRHLKRAEKSMIRYSEKK